MKWIHNFEKEFQVKKSENDSYNIIIGESPYKQKLEKDFKTPFNRAKPEIYKLTRNVAFFVTDWAKIQDTLEMVFNILTGDSNTSLKMLCHLRSNNIPADEFAIYLYNTCKIAFVNRFSSKSANGKCVGDTRNSITKCLNGKSGNILFVGKKSSFKISGSWNCAQCLHPSGNNLRLSEKYFKTFYKLDNSEYEKLFETRTFDISNFKILL